MTQPMADHYGGFSAPDFDSGPSNIPCRMIMEQVPKAGCAVCEAAKAADTFEIVDQ